MKNTVFDIANYFLCQQDNDSEDYISNLKLQKLCYYAQGFHLALHDVRLFDNDIKAWQHGPVVPELYYKYKDLGRDPLPISESFSLDILKQDVKDLLNDVYQEYGQYSAWRLRDMTHQEVPWRNAKKKSDDTISDSDMKSFFKKFLA